MRKVSRSNEKNSSPSRMRTGIAPSPVDAARVCLGKAGEWVGSGSKMARAGSRGWAALVAGFVMLAVITGCESGDEDLMALSQYELPAEQDAFWASVLDLCGMAFEGTDDEVRRVMHVRQCYPDEIRIPLHVDDNRSRTWILTRTSQGIRLKHDHRYEDGTEEEITQYGGDTDEVGTANMQTFPADEFTRTVIAAEVGGAQNNIWRMEIIPGEEFAYRLTRSTFDNALRWAFDLTTPVDPPPAPWGYEDTEPTHEPG